MRSFWLTRRALQFLAALGLVVTLAAMPAARAQDMPVASDVEMSGADWDVPAFNEAIENGEPRK